MAGSQLTPRDFRDNEGTVIGRVLEAAAGYVASLILLVYPIGLLTLALQLWTAYKYPFFGTVYMASLAPAAVAAAQVLHSLIWFIGASFIVQVVRILLLVKRDEDTGEQQNEQPQRSFWAKTRKQLRRVLPNTATQWAITGLLIFVMITPFNTPTPWIAMGLPPPLAAGVRGILLCVLFIVLVFVAGVLSSRLQAESRARSLWKRLLAEAPVFIITILASIAVAGAQDPQLPAVELESGEETGEHYYLLAHQGEYWFLFSTEGELSAIPSTSRRLWVRFFYRFKGVHREVAL